MSWTGRLEQSKDCSYGPLRGRVGMEMRAHVCALVRRLEPEITYCSRMIVKEE